LPTASITERKIAPSPKYSRAVYPRREQHRDGGRQLVNRPRRIEHEHLLGRIPGGEEGANGGAINALEPPQPEDGGGHYRARIAGRIDGRGLAPFDQVHGHVDAGVPLAAHHRGLFVHAH
jgi:hypothetical protein